MTDVRDLYQEMILDHGRHPRNHHASAGADRRAEGHNPLCGDRITVFARTQGDRIEEIGFEGSGCAISIASASMMSEALRGATIDEAEQRFVAFHEMLTGKAEGGPSPSLGKLVVFSGVCRYPVRIKCATLAWHTLRAALDQRRDAVSTE
jgi:nitrogen fixation protein NifU and related proteins